MGNTNWLLYARVSTEKQSKKDTSVHDQLSYLKSMCKEKDWNIMGVFYDNGFTSKDQNRPALRYMLSFMKKYSNIIDGVAFYHNDRLTRSKKGFYGEILDVFKDYNIRPLFTNMPDIDPRDIEGDLILANLINISEYFRKDGARKVKFGMHQKAKKGGWIGKAPTGYKIIDGDLIIDEFESSVIKYLYNTYITDDISFRNLREMMKSHSIYSKMKWSLTKVDYILRNPVYLGIMLTPDGELVAGNHEAIITGEQFISAMEKRKSRSRFTGNKTYNIEEMFKLSS